MGEVLTSKKKKHENAFLETGDMLEKGTLVLGQENLNC
jgi:hypothetical protein